MRAAKSPQGLGLGYEAAELRNRVIPCPLHHVIDAPSHTAADAPVVLLLNSIGADHTMWDPQVKQLSAAGFRVIRSDTRGHGQSPVPLGPYSIDQLVEDSLALLDRLGLASAHVVGLSLGGMTALRLAARHPDRVDRLAILSASSHLDATRLWLERADLVRTNGVGAIASSSVQRWFTEAFHANEPDQVRNAEEMIRSTPAEGYAGCCEAIAGMDLRQDLSSIKAPTLVIAGADDQATPTADLQRVAEGIGTNASLLVIQAAAHLVNIEQPEAVTLALLNHFQ